MFAIICLALLGETYAEAHAANAKDGKPILVAVGAEWCPGCKTDEATLAAIRKAGGLAGVHYAHVDVDAEPALARRLLVGTAIPQTVLYRREGKRWTAKRLKGPQTRAAFEALLK